HHATHAGALPRGYAEPSPARGGPGIRELGSPNPQDDGQFGYAVAGVPDADGDGRGDLLVGAYQEEGAGQSYAGRAYVFSGATGVLLHALVSPNPAFGRLFGSSVAGVPDVDGDGRGDLLVGEPGALGAGLVGRAYVFSGATGALLHELASLDPEAGGLFGIWVAG